MPAPLSSRDEVIGRLFEVFRDHGYDGATLSLASEATGLGKSSLYHYFPNGKDDMARAVLGRAAAWLAEQTAAIDGPGDPRARLERFLQAINGLYAGGRHGCVLGKIALDTGDGPFRRLLADAFGAWIGALERLAQESGVPAPRARERAEDAVAAIQGALVLAAALADRDPFRRQLEAIPDRLLARA